MNEIINKFLLQEINSYLKSLVLVNHLLKSNKEYKSLKKQDIQGIFIMAKNLINK